MTKKPCPFCGSTDSTVISPPSEDRCWVQCSLCGAEGPLGSTKQDAVDRWNRRATEEIDKTNAASLNRALQRGYHVRFYDPDIELAGGRRDYHFARQARTREGMLQLAYGVSRLGLTWITPAKFDDIEVFAPDKVIEEESVK
jgi:Lar family restriction alleviation protein